MVEMCLVQRRVSDTWCLGISPALLVEESRPMFCQSRTVWLIKWKQNLMAILGALSQSWASPCHAFQI